MVKDCSAAIRANIKLSYLQQHIIIVVLFNEQTTTWHQGHDTVTEEKKDIIKRAICLIMAP